MIQESKEHLREVQKSYAEHAAFSIDHGFYLLKMGVMSIIHGIVPSVFKFDLPKMVIGLYDVVIDKHGIGMVRKLRKQNLQDDSVRSKTKSYFK